MHLSVGSGSSPIRTLIQAQDPVSLISHVVLTRILGLLIHVP